MPHNIFSNIFYNILSNISYNTLSNTVPIFEDSKTFDILFAQLPACGPSYVTVL
jgi:hypothetical protein